MTDRLVDVSLISFNEPYQIPPGLEIERSMDPVTMREIIRNFCELTTTEIIDDIEKGKDVKLNFAMDGGFLIYWELRKNLLKYPAYFDKIEFIFAAKVGKDDHGENIYATTEPTHSENTVVFYNIDDIFDNGGSDTSIRNALSSLTGVKSSEFKTRVVSTKIGKNYYEVPLQYPQYYRFKAKWVTAGFGMNSGMFEGIIEILERMAGVSLYIVNPNEEAWKRWTSIDIRNYQRILIDNPYFAEEGERNSVFSYLTELYGFKGIHKLESIQRIHERLNQLK